ncbi:flagellar biosynthetic protein FliR [Planktotalea arctica]|uniref:flagellar biosynthetic protein FliR n=1 Tax=Planktotalea arctica TaxID=1481893 RepID=UPI000A17504A|nr:flagellar biosynthetic protein FliR [Planktotalea arctica]
MNALLPSLWEPLVFGFLAMLFRVSALVAMLPALGEASIPARIKLGLAICMTMVIYPIIPLPDVQAIEGAERYGLLLSEIGVGLWFGLLLRVFVFCLQTAGSIAAQSTSLSQILGTAGVEPLPAMGHVITMAGLTLALTLGLHVSAAQYLIGSYALFPMGDFPDLGALAETGVAQIAWGFKLAFTLAAPFIILSLLYNLTLGVINRAMPQLMVAFVGAPVITAGALFLLAIAIPSMLGTWVDALFGFLATGELR